MRAVSSVKCLHQIPMVCGRRYFTVGAVYPAVMVSPVHPMCVFVRDDLGDERCVYAPQSAHGRFEVIYAT